MDVSFAGSEKGRITSQFVEAVDDALTKEERWILLEVAKGEVSAAARFQLERAEHHITPGPGVGRPLEEGGERAGGLRSPDAIGQERGRGFRAGRCRLRGNRLRPRKTGDFRGGLGDRSPGGSRDQQRDVADGDHGDYGDRQEAGALAREPGQGQLHPQKQRHRRADREVETLGEEQAEEGPEDPRDPGDEQAPPEVDREDGRDGGGDDQKGEDHNHATDPDREGDHDPEQRVEEEVPGHDLHAVPDRRIVVAGDPLEGMAQHVEADPDRAEGHGADEKVGPGRPQNAARQHVLGVDVAARCNANEEESGGGGDGVGDANDRLLGDLEDLSPGQSVEGGRPQGQGEGCRVGEWGARAGAGGEVGADGTHGDDLGQSDVDEDDLPAQNVDAQVAEDGGHGDAGEEGKTEQLDEMEHGVSPPLYGRGSATRTTSAAAKNAPRARIRVGP
jgi:hypothetical protein